MKFKIGDIVRHKKIWSLFLFIKDIDRQNYIIQCMPNFLKPFPNLVIDELYDLVDDEKTIHHLLLKISKNEI